MTTQVALITGAARRVGAAIASYLHQQGINVVIHCRTKTAEAEALCHTLNKQRAHSATWLQADLTQTATLSNLVTDAVAVWGRLDVLVNNASGFYATPIGTVSPAQWDDLQASNVKGAFFLAQAAYPYLKTHEGAIINITDIHAERPLREYGVYCIAKAGLAMMTQVLAREMAPAVRVNAVAPGGVAWPEGDNELDDMQKNAIVERTLLKRHGSPQDIAQAVYFLCMAPYITGQTLRVDGGAVVRV